MVVRCEACRQSRAAQAPYPAYGSVPSYQRQYLRPQLICLLCRTAVSGGRHCGPGSARQAWTWGTGALLQPGEDLRTGGNAAYARSKSKPILALLRLAGQYETANDCR